MVYPDNYLIPNNYDFWEYGDPWPGTMKVKTNGNIIVYSWLEMGLDTSNYALCYKVTDRWGNTIHDADTIKEPTQSQVYKSPQLEVFANGKFIITWIDESNPAFGRDTYYQIFDQNGFKINNEVRVNTDSTQADQGGIPVVLPNGNFCVINYDDVLNPPSGFTDYWIQCYDQQQNPIGGYNYIDRFLGVAYWTTNIAINDSLILFIRPSHKNSPPNYFIASIRLNDKGQKLDSTWFEWTAFQMDSIYKYQWEVEYYNGSIYASTRKPTYINLNTTNTVVAKFSYDNSFVTDTVAPVASKIVQITPWKVVNDDTLQTNITSLMPALGIMHDLNKLVVSWPDDRNNLGFELYTQYFDTSLNKINLNFLSSNNYINPAMYMKVDAAKDFFVQLWLSEGNQPISGTKMWTNIWSLSTSINENELTEEFLIYPNPTNKSIKIEHNGNGKVIFKVSDIFGRILKEGYITNRSEVDVSEIRNGLYFLNLYDGSKTNIVWKFIKN